MFPKKKALIIGCGWVGLRFAKKLLAQGFEVRVTSTSLSKVRLLKLEGFIPLLVDFNFALDTAIRVSLCSHCYELVLVSVPAKKREDLTACIKKFERLSQFLQTIKTKSIVYLSSVGIYPNAIQPISETTIPNQLLDPKLFQAEQVLAFAVNKLNILRLGGIFGDNRIPGKHFSGKACEVGKQLANYIHVEDIIAIILFLYKQGIEGQLFNAVSPIHPSKMEIILKMASKYNYPLPSSFEEIPSESKCVSSKKLIEAVGYQFQYENPLDY